MGYIGDASLYEFVGGDPGISVDPEGLARQPGSGPATTPTTGPTTAPSTQPAIAGPGEHVVHTQYLGNWEYPYDCNVPGAGSGLGLYGPMLEKVFGKAARDAFAKALGLTPDDISRYGYSTIADFERARVQRDSDKCERDVTYVDVSEFIAVPAWKDLYDWEKDHINKSGIAAGKYPNDKMATMPNPAPGFQEWNAIRAIWNKAGGRDSGTLADGDAAKLMQLAAQRRKNRLRIILDESPWQQPAPVPGGMAPPIQ